MLKNYISREDYHYVISSVNLTLRTYWPCDFAICLGYILAPFSFGLSLMLPNLCIRDAKEALMDTVRRMNALKLKERGLKMTYRQRCSTSWLEVEIIEPKHELQPKTE